MKLRVIVAICVRTLGTAAENLNPSQVDREVGIKISYKVHPLGYHEMNGDIIMLQVGASCFAVPLAGSYIQVVSLRIKWFDDSGIDSHRHSSAYVQPCRQKI